MFPREQLMQACKDHFVYVPSQWVMTLQCNIISHWLGTFTKLSLKHTVATQWPLKHVQHLLTQWSIQVMWVLLVIHPASTKLKGGYTGFTLSVCPSVHLSVCGQNRVHSVSSTIIVRSISYLKDWNFGEFLKFTTLTLSSFDLRSNMIQ